MRTMVLDRDTPRTRRSDPVTSHEAADGTQSSVVRARDEVLEILEAGPLADFEIHEASLDALRFEVSRARYFSPQRLRTARAELARDGYVRFTGYFRLTVSGYRARVWELCS